MINWCYAYWYPLHEYVYKVHEENIYAEWVRELY